MYYYSRLSKIFEEKLLLFGYRTSKTTIGNNLENFFSKIRPIECEISLIRIGGQNDGGYLIPDDLDGIKECYSPGVALTSNFEDELSSRGIICYLADYSVDGPPTLNPLFLFQKKFLGVKSDDIYIRLDDWIESTSQYEADKILQMDIEGAEWSVLCSTPSKALKQFRIIVLEFHNMDGLFDPIIFRQINDVFDLLLLDFQIVHIHPNNSSSPVSFHEFKVPPVMEFTFLRRDRINKPTFAKKFPHTLDRPNVMGMVDYPLPTCWYK